MIDANMATQCRQIPHYVISGGGCNPISGILGAKFLKTLKKKSLLSGETAIGIFMVSP